MITIGADPEVFLGTQEGIPASAENIVPGVKEAPHQVGDIQIMIDNVAAEFAIPPCQLQDDFLEKVDRGKGLINLFAEANGLKMLYEISTLFPEDQLQSSVAQTFGCDPDLNIYGEPERRPIDPRLRSVGGHVHLGAPMAIEAPKRVVALFDLILGLPFFFYDREWNRASLYGKMGTYRKKEYGVEYRTLSNSWIWDRRLATVVYQRAEWIGKFKSLYEMNCVIENLVGRSLGWLGHAPQDIYTKQVENKGQGIFGIDLLACKEYDRYLSERYRLYPLYS